MLCKCKVLFMSLDQWSLFIYLDEFVPQFQSHCHFLHLLPLVFLSIDGLAKVDFFCHFSKNHLYIYHLISLCDSGFTDACFLFSRSFQAFKLCPSVLI